VTSEGGDYVAFTNVSDEDATLFHLARRGYGSIAELELMDTPQFLDLVEFEHIQNDIELYHVQRSRER
jgi:hypothetical protein